MAEAFVEIPNTLTIEDRGKVNKALRNIDPQSMPKGTSNELADWKNTFYTTNISQGLKAILTGEETRPRIEVGATGQQIRAFRDTQVHPFDLKEKLAQDYLLKILSANHSAECAPDSDGNIPSVRTLYTYIQNYLRITNDPAGTNRQQIINNWQNCLTKFSPEFGTDFFQWLDEIKSILKNAVAEYNTFHKNNNLLQKIEAGEAIQKVNSLLQDINIEAYKIGQTYNASQNENDKTIEGFFNHLKSFDFLKNQSMIQGDYQRFLSHSKSIKQIADDSVGLMLNKAERNNIVNMVAQKINNHNSQSNFSSVAAVGGRSFNRGGRSGRGRGGRVFFGGARNNNFRHNRSSHYAPYQQSQNNNNHDNNKQTSTSNNTDNPLPPSNNHNPNIQCHNCQGFGHISTNCPTPRSNNYSGGGRGFQRGNGGQFSSGRHNGRGRGGYGRGYANYIGNQF